MRLALPTPDRRCGPRGQRGGGRGAAASHRRSAGEPDLAEGAGQPVRGPRGAARAGRAADARGAGARHRRRRGAAGDPHPPARRQRATTWSRLYLLIDANPSPVAAIFQFAPRSGRAEIETRVRVDEYSFVRAIAETSDGQLYGVVRFVKASGGCSAPAATDASAAAAALGRMQLRVDAAPTASCRRTAGAGAARDQPPQPLRPGDGPGHAPVHAGALRAQGRSHLPRRAGVRRPTSTSRSARTRTSASTSCRAAAASCAPA